MRCHKKSTLHISIKLDIICNPLDQFTYNAARYLDSPCPPVLLRLSLKHICDNMLNATFSTDVHPVVHNAYLLQRTIQTGIDDIKIKVNKVRRGISQQRQ
ncbi:MAG: hypothetical protein ACTS73_05855 [Arsenophonus sp. NEOnobi-MAG3]